jgi:hypothetical protein
VVSDRRPRAANKDDDDDESDDDAERNARRADAAVAYGELENQG